MPIEELGKWRLVFRHAWRIFGQKEHIRERANSHAQSPPEY